MRVDFVDVHRKICIVTLWGYPEGLCVADNKGACYYFPEILNKEVIRTAILGILQSNSYVIHPFSWREPFDRPVRDELEAPMISVGRRINERAVQQLVTIWVKNGQITFYPGNGFARDAVKSTYLQDSDERKFLSELSQFIAGMHRDSYGGGYYIKDISQF